MKHLQFRNARVTLVITPRDLRAGYRTLSTIALAQLNINVEHGNDIVMFLSRTRQMAKVIFCDESGTCLVTRKLHAGRFQQLLKRVTETTSEPRTALTVRELESYLDGQPLMVCAETKKVG